MIESYLSDNALQEIVNFTHEAYDFDFSGYAPESLKRRFVRLMDKEKIQSTFEYKYAVTNGQLSRDKVLNEITVNVTDLFRDPALFHALTKHIFPYLRSFPQFKVWHAGCSSGQEMYSLAIALKEHQLLERSIQYGTDINSEVLNKAKKGLYDLSELPQYAENYQKAGGQQNLSDYYESDGDNLKMNTDLRSHMVFSSHDLVKNTSFNEFQLILCRNVLIYFDQSLQNHVLKLFVESLAPYGYLVLGDKETIAFSEVQKQLEVVDSRQRIYRKKGVVND